MITARSTSTILPWEWEGSPRPSRPPSLSLSEGSSTSEALGGSSKSEALGEIQSTALTSDGSSASEGPGGIQSTATPSDGSSISEGPGGIQSIAPSIAAGMKIIFKNYFVQKFKTRPR